MTHISETAYLVAFCRAMETDRPDPLFRDPLARRLAGGKGALHAAVLGDVGAIATAIAIRTRVIDEILLQTLQHQNIDTVLNLGAGLDTRPYRLPLSPDIQWIEADFPEIFQDKSQKLHLEQPRCHLTRISLDLSDPSARQELLTKVNKTSQKVLTLTEGVLGYLTASQVADLAQDLYQQPNFQHWLIEFTDCSFLEQVQKQYKQKIFSQYFTHKNEAFSFAPPQGLTFFESHGWLVNDFRSIWQETHRLNRANRWSKLQAFWVRSLNPKHWSEAEKKNGIVLLNRFFLT